MDPHSRLSQYNKRRPSNGPAARVMEHKPQMASTASEQFKKPSAGGDSHPMAQNARTVKRRTDVKSLKSIATRPIATNSRIRREEKIQRDMYLAYVDNVLSEKAKGNVEPFNQFVRLFSRQNNSPEAQEAVLQLRSYLAALSHVVSKLDRTHIALVDAIVHMPWAIMDTSFVKAYISFMGMLVSARPEYLNSVSEMTAQSLTYQAAKKSLGLGFAESSSSPLTRRTVYDRVHNLLQQLISLVPTLPSILYPILARHFPHKRQAQFEHVTYIRNLLRLSDYCPELSDRLLGLVVDKTIQIDVEIQVELEELETDGDADNEDLFPVDIFDTVIGQEGDSSESEDEEEGGDDEDNFSDLSSDAGSERDQDEDKEHENHTKHVREMVTKLDCILEVIFKHLDRRSLTLTKPMLATTSGTSTPLTPLPALVLDASFPLPASPVILVPSTSPPPPPSPPPALDLSLPTADDADIEAQRTLDFHTLLSIFDRTIIRTFKSRYTQFLLFWYSSLNNTFRDHFLGTVVSKALLEVDQPVVTRATAASYVASYVSRANFVDRTETRNVVRLFCNFIESHLGTFDECLKLQEMGKDAVKQSAEQHSVFYAAAQAVFLVFCFRWRDLLEQDPNEVGSDGLDVNPAVVTNKVWLPELNVIQRAVTSPLNPLKVCSSNVVLQFALVAQKVGFMYCYPIIEANKRADYAIVPPTREGQSALNNRKGLNALMAKQSFDADLSTFFPFDPYKLPRSCSFIEGIYRDWTAVAIEDEEEDEEEDEDEDDSIDGGRYREEEDYHMHGPSSFVDRDADMLGTSLGGMSISPVHHMRPPLTLAT